MNRKTAIFKLTAQATFAFRNFSEHLWHIIPDFNNFFTAC